jgi:hypothetical protein
VGNDYWLTLLFIVISGHWLGLFPLVIDIGALMGELIIICRFNYMPSYEVWVHHGEEVPENELVAKDAMTDEDRMDEMLNAICPEFEEDFEDPPTVTPPS